MQSRINQTVFYMRNYFTYVLSAAMLTTSLTVSAQSLRTVPQGLAKVAKTPTAGMLKGKKASDLKIAQNSVRPNAFRALVRRYAADEDLTPITNPEGTKTGNLQLSDFNTYLYFGYYLMTGQDRAALSSYIVAPNGDIYFQPFASYFPSSGYLKISKEKDGSYVAHTPQVIYTETTKTDAGEDSTIYAFATRLTMQKTSDGLLYAVDSIAKDTYNMDMKFTFENDVLKQVDQSNYGKTSYANEIIGLTDAAGSWYGYSLGQITIKPLDADDVAATLPSDTVRHDAVFSYDTPDTAGVEHATKTSSYYYTSKSNPSAVYVANPYNKDSKQYIAGTINADKSWSFKKQYLGADSTVMQHLWFIPGTYTVEKGTDYYGDPAAENDYAIDSLSDKLVLKYADGVYKSDAGKALLVNASKNKVYYVGAYADPQYQDFKEVAATPADPSFTAYQAYTSDYDYGFFAFKIPCADTKGNFINPDKLYYNVFVDGDETEPYEFETADYKNLTANMTNVPYSFADSNDFYATNDDHEIYYHVDGVDKWGLQSVYTGGGETHKSNVVWFDAAAAGVKSVINNGKSTVAYYDLTGRRVSKAQGGLFIKKITYADGSQKTVKVLK